MNQITTGIMQALVQKEDAPNISFFV